MRTKPFNLPSIAAPGLRKPKWRAPSGRTNMRFPMSVAAAQIKAEIETGIRTEIRTEQQPAHGRKYRPGRSPRGLPHSPSFTLWTFLRDRTTPLNPNRRPILRDTAGSSSLRSPVMALQAVMLERETEAPSAFLRLLPSRSTWRSKLTAFGRKFFTQDDIEHWNWIMTADSPDARIERYVSSDRHIPIFVLLQILRTSDPIAKPRSLASLYDYTSQKFCTPHSPFLRSWEGLAEGQAHERPPSLDHRHNMVAKPFAMYMKLLVYHTMRLWPSAIVAVARLFAQFVESVDAERGDSKRSVTNRYRKQCRLLNVGLQLFSQASRMNPLRNRRYNWRAQKILLAMSTKFERPLIINREGFRAVRKVLIGLSKSVAEQDVAARLKPTWPPYRQDWDGLDEQRRAEDDYSRSVKAGTLMFEAGYPAESYDVALGVLGGAELGQSPYVQTRSIPQKVWTGALASQNIFSDWAARVRATRNAQEAWQMFQRPPQEGLAPNIQVYTEMFAKLLARETEVSPTTLPGDAKEVLPVYDVNLSDHERQRLQPPSVRDLYQQMKTTHNLRPVDDCLVLLLSHARSFHELRELLEDSHLNKEAVDAFVSYIIRGGQVDGLTSAAVHRIRFKIFNACIAGVCNSLPIYKAALGQLPRGPVRRIRNLIHLTESRVRSADVKSRATWHVLVRALARPNLAASPDLRPPYDTRNRLEALRLLMVVRDKVRTVSGGPDLLTFFSLCLVVRRLYKFGDHEQKISPSNTRLIAQAHQALKDDFAGLTEPVRDAGSSSGDRLELPPLFHQITPIHVQHYIRTLGLIGDVDEMVRVVEWTVGAWESSTFEEEAKEANSKHHAAVAAAFTAFRAFAVNQIPAELMDKLEARMNELREEQDCTWSWPTLEQTIEYVETEQLVNERSQEFWAKARKYLQQQQASAASGTRR